MELDYAQLAEEFFTALCKRPHGPWRPHGNPGENANTGDPSKGEFPVLKFIELAGGPVTPGQISEARKLSSARIANILTSMEKKGLVQRVTDANDRRKVLVTLTDAGRAFAYAKHREAMEDAEWLLRQMGDEDALEMIRLEKKMTEIVRNEYEKQGR